MMTSVKPLFLAKVVQELEHLVLALAIEIAGGLVGQEQGGFIGQGSGDGNALALADREVHRAVVPALRQADLIDQPLRALDTLSTAQSRLEHRYLNVLNRAQSAQDMERLEDEADLAGAVLISVDPGQRRAPKVNIAGARCVESAEQVQERALAASAGPHDGNGLVLPHLE